MNNPSVRGARPHRALAVSSCPVAPTSRPDPAQDPAEARALIADMERIGYAGAIPWIALRLTSALVHWRQQIESKEKLVVGVNAFTTTEPNPLTANLDAAIQTVDPTRVADDRGPQ